MSVEEPGGASKSKLVASKERRAKQKRGLSAPDEKTDQQRPRLPPGQYLVQNWPVLDLGLQPVVDPCRWSLTIDGLVEQPVHWSWSDYNRQPRFHDRSDMHCVTGWSRYDNDWQGVATAYILASVKPLATARYVLCHSYDGYTTNLSLEHFSAADALIADHWQGEPLARAHGGPARLIVPQLYLWKSAKWLTRIEFRADDLAGFWEVRGYHNVGDPWREERYSNE